MEQKRRDEAGRGGGGTTGDATRRDDEWDARLAAIGEKVDELRKENEKIVAFCQDVTEQCEKNTWGIAAIDEKVDELGEQLGEPTRGATHGANRCVSKEECTTALIALRDLFKM